MSPCPCWDFCFGAKKKWLTRYILVWFLFSWSLSDWEELCWLSLWGRESLALWEGVAEENPLPVRRGEWISEEPKCLRRWLHSVSRVQEPRDRAPNLARDASTPSFTHKVENLGYCWKEAYSSPYLNKLITSVQMVDRRMKKLMWCSTDWETEKSLSWFIENKWILALGLNVWNKFPMW